MWRWDGRLEGHSNLVKLGAYAGGILSCDVGCLDRYSCSRLGTELLDGREKLADSPCSGSGGSTGDGCDSLHERRYALNGKPCDSGTSCTLGVAGGAPWK